MDLSLDKILLDLKILGKIPKNGKLCRGENDNLDIESNIYFQWVKRTYRNDSRKQAINDIEQLVNRIEKMIDGFQTEGEARGTLSGIVSFNVFNLHTELKNSIQGLENLSNTYVNDATTVSKIEIIITRIKFMIEIIKSKNYVV